MPRFGMRDFRLKINLEKALQYGLVAPPAVAYDLHMTRLLVLILVWCALVIPGFAEEAEKERPMVPDLEFRSMDGKATVKLSSFRGRPVLLTFWASWCGPCRVELPELQELYAELVGKGFVLMTINVDNSPQVGQRFLASTGVKVPVYRMDRMAMHRLGINSLPTNILISPEGRAVHAYNGYHPKMSAEIRELVLEMTEGRPAEDADGENKS
jgi:thiol-disulfide isomerase/thioredoxin